jgi:hypothetical protein
MTTTPAPEYRPLWTFDHPYYCSESNYFATGSQQPYVQYASWPEFLAEEGDADMDYNLVFRWDWKPIEFIEDDSPAGHAAYHAKYDDNYRAYTLQVFWMGQRKGLFRCTEVSVCRADEPSVREWLTVRGEYLRRVWEPLLGDVSTEVTA